MRYPWLDYLRGIAAIWMIEVHVVDVALAADYHRTWWYPWLSLTHGFVAVAFLFCAGGALGIVLERKLAVYRRGEQPLWDYLAKLGLLLVLGYWLHLPAFSLERTLTASPAELTRLADCDILQTIAYSSLLALGIALLLPRALHYLALYAALMFAFAVLAPMVWSQNLYQRLPLFLGALVAPQPVSKFPLFPFAAYFFAGAWIVPLLLSSARRTVALLGAGCALLTAVLLVIGMNAPKQWWHISPAHVAFRLSGTLAVLSALWLWHEQLERWRFSRVLLLAGQQSLWIYIFHLLLVYGSVGGKGLSTVVHRSLSPLATALLFAAVAAVSLATAQLWAHLKRTSPQLVRTVIAAALAVGAVTYVLLPARYAELLTMGATARRDVPPPAVERGDLPR